MNTSVQFHTNHLLLGLCLGLGVGLGLGQSVHIVTMEFQMNQEFIPFRVPSQCGSIPLEYTGTGIGIELCIRNATKPLGYSHLSRLYLYLSLMIYFYLSSFHRMES